MERGNEFSSHHKHAKYTAGSSLAAGSSGMNLVNTNYDFLNNHPTNMPNALSYANINTVQTTTNKREGRQCGGAVREQDQYMPIANVIRIMRRVLPPHAKISDEAKETVQECVSEFISFITGEANDRCQREQRKTITAEDVLWAMAKLGFDDYLEPLSLFLTRHRENENQGCSSMHDLLASLKRSAATAAAAAAADCVCVPSAAMMMPSMMPAAGNFQMGDQQWQLGMDAAAASALPGGFHTPALPPPPPPPAASGDAGQDGFSNYDSYAQYKRQ